MNAMFAALIGWLDHQDLLTLCVIALFSTPVALRILREGRQVRAYSSSRGSRRMRF